MRKGSNPEKKIYKKILYKPHRVIIPVYIPDSSEVYFKNLFPVFKVSINSLLKTTDKKFTNITIVNNNCKVEVTNFIDVLLKENKIDKHIKLVENYGKVYTILSEAKASYEDYITISDADVFYYSGWLNATNTIFNMFKNVGVVSPLPMPQLGYYCNNSLFFNRFFNIKKGKVILDKDIALFEKSIDSKISLKRNNWYKQQLYLEKNNVKACVGAGHFIAIYKREALHNIKFKKTKYAFEDGAEKYFLDEPIDQLGYYRVSTINTYVYHLGNHIPDWVKSYKFDKCLKNTFEIKKKNSNLLKMNYKVKGLFQKVHRKLIKF